MDEKVKGRWVSGSEMQQKAREIMLDGREPASDEDWMLCANFWARNLATGFEVPVTKIMGTLFDCPLSEKTLRDIALYQAIRKADKVVGEEELCTRS